MLYVDVHVKHDMLKYTHIFFSDVMKTFLGILK